MCRNTCPFVSEFHRQLVFLDYLSPKLTFLLSADLDFSLTDVVFLVINHLNRHSTGGYSPSVVTTDNTSAPPLSETGESSFLRSISEVKHRWELLSEHLEEDRTVF